MAWTRARTVRFVRFGAPAAAAGVWFLHLSLSYALVPAACRVERALPLVIVSIVGVLLGIGCAVAAARVDAGSDRGSLATTGAALATYFTLIMVFAGLVPLIVEPCA